MITRFVIVKKYNINGTRYADRVYWGGHEVGFISGIFDCIKFEAFFFAEIELRRIMDTGIFQIEPIYIKK